MLTRCWCWMGLLFLGVPAVHAAAIHSVDMDQDGAFSLGEVLRLIQLYNAGGYSCDAAAEGGFAPGAGDRSCAPHASDYAAQDWRINLSEILRTIQIYNSRGYFACADGEDGFCRRRRAQRPNVLMVLVDTLRADRVGRLRDGETILPYLTSFAAGGTSFTRAYSTGPWTRPGMCGILAGRHPNRYLIEQVIDPEIQACRFGLYPEDEPMGEWLARYGYDCWVAQTNANLPDENWNQGIPPEHRFFLNGGPGPWVTDTLLNSRANWKEPFFVYAHYMDVHGPYAPPAGIEYPFAPEPVLTGSDAALLDLSFWRNYTRDLLYAYHGLDPRDYPDLTPAGIEVLQSRYDRDCYYFDNELRRLLETVLSEYPDTIVVITSDHGESMFDRLSPRLPGPMIGHGNTTHEEQLLVPLIFRGPGVPVQTIDRRVCAMGVLPTLAPLLEISPEDQYWEGQDLLNDPSPRPLYAYTKSMFLNDAIESSSIIDGDLKLIDDVISYGPLQLYDLAADPGEVNNIAEARPADTARLKGMLDEHRARVAPPVQ